MNQSIVQTISLLLTLAVLGPAHGQVVPRIGPNIEVDSLTSTFQQAYRKPDVAAIDTGTNAQTQRYAVTWTQYLLESPNFTSRIFLSMVNQLGDIDVPAFEVDLTLSSNPAASLFYDPAIAADGEGNFAVIWAAPYNAGGGQLQYRFKYQLFSDRIIGNQPVALMPSPAVLFSPFQSSPPLLSGAPVPQTIDVAASFDGRFVVAFSDVRPVPETGVLVASFDFQCNVEDASGNCTDAQLVPVRPDGSEPELTTVTTRAEYRAVPRIDINANDRTSWVTWRSFEGAIRARKLAPNGTLLGSAVTIAEVPMSAQISHHDPDVSIDLSNRAWITWESNQYQLDDEPSRSRILLSQLGPDGAPGLSGYELSTRASPSQPDRLVPRRGARIEASALDRSLAANWEELFNACDGPTSISSSNCGGLIPSAGGSCSIQNTYDIAGPAGCRAVPKLLPDEATPATDWYRFPRDAARDGVGSFSFNVLVEPNFSQTENRCFLVSFGSGSGEITRRFEQSCSGTTCETCAQQLGVAPAPVQQQATTDNRAVPTDAAEAGGDQRGGAFGGSVQMRWLQANFTDGDATFVEEFSVFDLPQTFGLANNPVVAMRRDGNLLAAWEIEPGFDDKHQILAQVYTTPVRLTINDVGILEGPIGAGRAAATFSVAASKHFPDPGTSQPRPMPSITVQTADDSASFLTDYEAKTETFVWADPGEPLVKSFSVEVTDDTVFEDLETFLVNMFDENHAIVERRQGVGAILDNDLPSTARAIDTVICEDGLVGHHVSPVVIDTLIEGDPPIPVTVTLSGQPTSQVSCPLSVPAPDIFVPGGVSTLVFPANAGVADNAEASFALAANVDPDGPEGPFTVGIGPCTSADPRFDGVDPSDVTITEVTDTARGSAVTGSGPADPGDFSCTGGPSRGSSNGSVRIPVILLEGAQEVNGSVEFATRDGVSVGDVIGAVSGEDYEGVTGEVQFIAGSTQGFVTVQLSDNDFSEPSKVFNLDLLDPSSLLVDGESSAVITILNDDICDTPPVPMPPAGTGQPLENLPSMGGEGFLCVVNATPDECTWRSRLDFAGQAEGWITATDFPAGADSPNPPDPQVLIEQCGSNVPQATGYIRYQAEPNVPNDTGDPNVDRIVTLVVEQGSIDPPSFVVRQLGDACGISTDPNALQFYSVGGQGEVSVSFDAPDQAPELCDGVPWAITLEPGADWIGNILIDDAPVMASTGPGTVTFTVASNAPPGEGRTGRLFLGGAPLSVIQEGAFDDHFDDNMRPTDWQYSNSPAWTEAGTHLTGTADTSSITAIADPAFPGCSDCTIRTAIRVDNFSKGQATLFAWYEDDNNHVSVSLDEFRNKVIINRRVDGVDLIPPIERSIDILVGEQLDIELSRDDAFSDVLVLTANGEALCPPVGSPSPIPICQLDAPPLGVGTVGFGVTNTAASFDRISVIRADGPAAPSVIFRDRFE